MQQANSASKLRAGGGAGAEDMLLGPRVENDDNLLGPSLAQPTMPSPLTRQLTSSDSDDLKAARELRGIGGPGSAGQLGPRGDGSLGSPMDSGSSFPKPPLFKRQLSGLADDQRWHDSDSAINLEAEGGDTCLNDGAKRVNVLMIGTGEYTTGFVDGASSRSDKAAGVVALTMFDLRRRGVIGRLGLCGTNGTKFPGIRKHMHECIGVPYRGNLSDTSVETFPPDNVPSCPSAYLNALQLYRKGDVAIIFTPDHTHFDIALACIEHGLHVLLTKPAVKTLEQHHQLAAAAARRGVLVGIEVHKRWDPIYTDARDRITSGSLGPFSYLYSYMSQPKLQLETFRAWAGVHSDISYYLNSHHVDFHEWCVGDTARPVTVTATASTGVAESTLDRKCEDTITLTVQWENRPGGTGAASLGTAIYTASWIAPRSDVHSQQRFFYMGQRGEASVDQAHRGYTVASDPAAGCAGGEGLKSVNPLFMKYTPNKQHMFVGQTGYGYRSLEAFVLAAADVNGGGSSVGDYDEKAEEEEAEEGYGNGYGNEGSRGSIRPHVASIHCTYRTTAILEAGRRSLDAGGHAMEIVYGRAGASGGGGWTVVPTGIRPRSAAKK